MNRFNRVTLKRGLAKRVIDGKMYLVDSETSTLHQLNESGTIIVKKLEKGMGIERIINQIVEDYEVERKRAEKDVLFFIKGLKDKGLIIEDG